MIIIAFSTKTTKIMPRILCRCFRHCAPIVPTPHNTTRPWVMHQFVRPGVVVKIPLHTRDMNILRAHGWVFVNIDAVPCAMRHRRARTCVDYCRAMLGWRRRVFQTPDNLYHQLQKK